MRLLDFSLGLAIGGLVMALILVRLTTPSGDDAAARPRDTDGDAGAVGDNVVQFPKGAAA